MAINFNVDELFRDIDKMIEMAAATAAHTHREKEKMILTAVVEKMKLVRKDAATLLPAALEHLKAQAEANLATAEKAQAEIAKALQDLEAMKAEAMKAAAAKTAAGGPTVSSAPMPPPEIDPALGARLRDELLASLGLKSGTAEGPTSPGKDIWEDWK